MLLALETKMIREREIEIKYLFIQKFKVDNAVDQTNLYFKNFAYIPSCGYINKKPRKYPGQKI